MHEKNNVQQVSLQPLLVFIVLMLMILMQMTTDQYVPSLPAITKVFNTNAAAIQLTLSLFNAWVEYFACILWSFIR